MNTVGLIGSLLLTFCGVPELYRTIKDKRCHLGWGFILMWLFGEIFCVYYSFTLGEIPLIINYTFNLGLAIVLTYFKIKDLSISGNFRIFVKQKV
jgi:uncharacterized protein with PQ loop repeat